MGLVFSSVASFPRAATATRFPRLLLLLLGLKYWEQADDCFDEGKHLLCDLRHHIAGSGYTTCYFAPRMLDIRRNDDYCCFEMTRSLTVVSYMMAVETVVRMVVELITVLADFSEEVLCMELIVRMEQIVVVLLVEVEC